jgi:hypothetical protein
MFKGNWYLKTWICTIICISSAYISVYVNIYFLILMGISALSMILCLIKGLKSQ